MANEGITLRIKNLDYINSLRDKANTLSDEMAGVNVRNNPVQTKTMIRWRQLAQDIAVFFSKISPTDTNDTSEIREDEHIAS